MMDPSIINLTEVKAMLKMKTEDTEAYSFVKLLLSGKDKNMLNNKNERVQSTLHFEQTCHGSRWNAEFTDQMGSQSRHSASTRSMHDGSRRNAEFTDQVGSQSRPSASTRSMHDAQPRENSWLKRSLSAPIKIPTCSLVSYDNGVDELMERMKYDKATWNMYRRITSHRRNMPHINGSCVSPNPTFPSLPDEVEQDNANSIPQFPMS